MVTLPGLRWHGGSRGVRDREEVSKARGRSSARRISCVYGAAFSAEGLQGLVRDDQHLVSDVNSVKAIPTSITEPDRDPESAITARTGEIDFTA
jgi:hypothetical protein